MEVWWTPPDSKEVGMYSDNVRGVNGECIISISVLFFEFVSKVSLFTGCDVVKTNSKETVEKMVQVVVEGVNEQYCQHWSVEHFFHHDV